MKNIVIKVYFIINKNADIYFSVLFFFLFLFLAFVLLSRSVVSESATTQTVSHQVPLPMGILQARILEWVAMSFSMDLPNPGIELGSPALHVDSLLAELPGKPKLSLVTAYSFISFFVCLFYFFSRKIIVIFKQSDTLKGCSYV